jgi:hypothetical protein
MLEKLGAVVGVSNLHIYAAMRGETLEQFQKTRNAPGGALLGRGDGCGKDELGQNRRECAVSVGGKGGLRARALWFQSKSNSRISALTD